MPVNKQPLIEYAKRAMRTYGAAVNEDRSMPDYRDGLKPVHRRTMWALSSMGKDFTKTARVVGDVLGKYHPHSDQAAADAVETLVNAPVPLILGKGNWGSLVDNPAAMRYTNVKLSRYGSAMLQKDYLTVTDFVLNYDDKETEPVVLPALLPNILILGTEGIGVGTVSRIPSYTVKSLADVCVRLLDGEKLEPKDYVTSLEFSNRWGGRAVSSKANRKAMLEFYKTGSGKIAFEPNLKVDLEKRIIVWDTFALGASNPDKVEPKIKALAGVERYMNTTSKKDPSISYAIVLKKQPEADLERTVHKVKALVSGSKHFLINVTERVFVPPKTEKGYTTPGKIEVKFHTLTVPELLVKWLKWRVKLEVSSLAHRTKEQERAIEFTQLMILASDNLKVIFDSLKQKDSAAYISKHLKITVDQANIILDRQVRTLSKLNADEQQAKLKAQKAHLKQLNEWSAKPVRKVRNDIAELAAIIDKEDK